MKKFLITLFGCVAMALCFNSCSSPVFQEIFGGDGSSEFGTTEFDKQSVYTIASTMGAYSDPTLTSNNGFRAFYIVKSENSDKWFSVESINKFEYELGYEYVVKGTLLTSEEQEVADAISILTVNEVLSKELKDSDLPAEDWQWSIDRYNEYFGSQE